MDVSITARHCTIPDSIRAHTETRTRRLTRYDCRLISADVIFETDRATKQAEVRLLVAGENPLIATGAGETFRAAVDRALERGARQLKRARGRNRTHKAVKATELVAPAGREA